MPRVHVRHRDVHERGRLIVFVARPSESGAGRPSVAASAMRNDVQDMEHWPGKQGRPLSWLPPCVAPDEQEPAAPGDRRGDGEWEPSNSGLAVPLGASPSFLGGYAASPQGELGDSRIGDAATLRDEIGTWTDGWSGDVDSQHDDDIQHGSVDIPSLTAYFHASPASASDEPGSAGSDEESDSDSVFSGWSDDTSIDSPQRELSDSGIFDACSDEEFVSDSVFSDCTDDTSVDWDSAANATTFVNRSASAHFAKAHVKQPDPAIEEAYQLILNRPRDKLLTRHDMFKCVEMLLNDDTRDYAARPRDLTGTGIFREEGRVRRAVGGDRWKNSGGNKGSSVWPNTNRAPRIRCKYGRITVADGSTSDTRYQVYSFIDSEGHGIQELSRRQSRRLYIVSPVYPSTSHLSATLVPAVHGSRDLNTTERYKTVETLLFSLELQTEQTSEVDIEAIHRLLRCVAELPESEKHLINKYERPDIVDKKQYKRFYLEVSSTKRRARSRASSVSKACSPPFDKWTNSGGKRGLVRLHTASKAIIQRRSGRVQPRVGVSASQRSLPDLKFFQFCIEATCTNAGSETSDSSNKVRSQKATLFHAFEAGNSKRRRSGKSIKTESKSSNSSNTVGSGADELWHQSDEEDNQKCRKKRAAHAFDGLDEPCSPFSTVDQETNICQQKLNAFCNSASNIDCVTSTVSTYGDAALPVVARRDLKNAVATIVLV